MKITIKGKDYNVKYTIRALFIFEQITGKPFEIKTLLDNYVFLYSMILANNNEDPIMWDEFIDALDNDKDLIETLNKVVSDYQAKDDLFAEDVDNVNGTKKN